MACFEGFSTMVFGKLRVAVWSNWPSKDDLWRVASKGARSDGSDR